MKKFTCTEDMLKVTHVVTGDVIEMHQGDSLSLPAHMVDDMCALGWGTADGATTGERKPGVVNLTPDNSKILHSHPAAAPKAAD